jgi:ribosomal protein L37AE/L43A
VDYDALWREFSRTLPEFEAAFPDDEACREYLIRMRWGGVPQCSRCGHDIVWWLTNGRFECAQCGHQTSVTAGTPLHGTRKPLKVWFRAIWEMLARKNGISAKYPQAYLDEFEFRFNRRLTNGTGRLVARALQNLVQLPHSSEGLIVQSVPTPRFAPT